MKYQLLISLRKYTILEDIYILNGLWWFLNILLSVAYALFWVLLVLKELFIGFSFWLHCFLGSFFYFVFCIIIKIRNFNFSFIIHLIVHKQIWLQSNPIYNKIKTSFVKSKLVTHVRSSSFFLWKIENIIAVFLKIAGMDINAVFVRVGQSINVRKFLFNNYQWYSI